MSDEKKFIPGKVFIIDGQDYLIPALTPRQAMEFQKKTRVMKSEIDKLLKEGLSDVELEEKKQDLHFGLALEVAYSAFSRNYGPEISFEMFQEMGNLATIIQISAYAITGEYSEKKS